MDNGIIKFVVFLVVVFLAVPFLPYLNRALSNSDDQQEITISEEAPRKVNKEGLITRDKYYQIQMGMTYEECVAIIGSDGELAEGDLGGTAEYSWKNPGVMEANFSFENGLVSGGGISINRSNRSNYHDLDMAEVRSLEKKAGKSAVITIAEYNKIRPGMTYDECVKIIGAEGSLSGGGGGNSVAVTDFYSWRNTPHNYWANISFQNGRVQSKTWRGKE